MFWKAYEQSDPPAQNSLPLNPLATFAMAALVLALVGLTVLAGPLHHDLQQIAQDLHDPSAYRAVNQLPQPGALP